MFPPFYPHHISHSIRIISDINQICIFSWTRRFAAKNVSRFRYTLRLRSFPETTFQALALGKIPEWCLGHDGFQQPKILDFRMLQLTGVMWIPYGHNMGNSKNPDNSGSTWFEVTPNLTNQHGGK